MADSLYVAASGALARMTDLETVANNLANADTTGFKRDRTLFDAALASALQRTDGERVPGAPGRVFVATGASRTDFGSGGIASTGSPLDVAIDGPGFFEVQTPEGTRYTRAGSFVVSDQGLLGTPDGFPVMTEGGPIAVDGRAVEILDSGQVVDARGAELGRLRVVDFAEPAALAKDGRNLFRAGEGAGPAPVTEPRFTARSVERSNVEPVRELAALVSLQRLFDATLQALRADDQTTERLIREVSG